MSRRPLAFFLVTTLWLFAVPAHAADFTGRVVGVSDGDTITELRQRHPEATTLERPAGGSVRRLK